MFPAAAVSSETGDGALSPRLTELAQPAFDAASPVRQARKLSVAPSGPGSLLRRGDRVIVEVRFDSGAAASLDALRAAGAQVVDVSGAYQTVTVATTPDSLPDLSRVAGVRGVTEVLAPLVSTEGLPPTTSTGPAASAVSAPPPRRGIYS